jgi:hypothetical protein
MGQPFAYAFLWFSLILSVVVYAVDIFTAYQLLALNKFTSQIEPDEIPFDIAKWIFSICIILSVVNLAYEYWRAITIMRRGSVAECFLDSLAARLESIRLGSGQGWKRFLVFAELTRSKKGIEYIALFTFFSFQCRLSAPLGMAFGTDSSLSLDPRALLRRPASGYQWIYHLFVLQQEASDRLLQFRGGPFEFL